MPRKLIFSVMTLTVFLSWGAMLNFAMTEDQARIARESANLAAAPADTTTIPQALAAKAEDVLKTRVAQASAPAKRAVVPAEEAWQEPGTGTAFDAYPLPDETVLALN